MATAEKDNRGQAPQNAPTPTYKDGVRAGLALAAKLIRTRPLVPPVNAVGCQAFDRREEFAKMLEAEAKK